MVNYKWNQTYDYVTIIVNVDLNIKSKDVDIIFKSKYLNINICGEKIEGELYKYIYHKDSSWYFDVENNNKTLIIELSKARISDDDIIWEKLFVNDEKVQQFCDININELGQRKRMEYLKIFHEN